jgi:transcriptional regulator of acetoin/glycerol metabolism
MFLGIAEGAFEEARQYTLTETRPWHKSSAREVQPRPLRARPLRRVLGGPGRRAAVGGARGRLLDEAWAKGPNLSAEERGHLATAIATAKVAATRNGLELCSRLFEVTGARSTHASLRLDRHWRNLRTQTLHDPVDYKLHELGDWALNQACRFRLSIHNCPTRSVPHATADLTALARSGHVDPRHGPGLRRPEIPGLARPLQQVAPSEASVLIIGETGTGKELVARHIHNLSARRNRPFVAVNCGAFSESLVEAELFGHEKGAFTGALSAKAGWFEEADGGTLFLDEIGDLPMAIQVKLLRVLQEREVVRLGSRKSIPIDVRVLAATNVQLEKAINAGHFREDLYYRLDVVSLELSPLRERPGDILPLTRHFIDAYSQRLGYGRSPSAKKPNTNCAATVGRATSANWKTSFTTPC